MYVTNEAGIYEDSLYFLIKPVYGPYEQEYVRTRIFTFYVRLLSEKKRPINFI